MSRHRFDHSVDRNDDTKEVPAPVRLRRIEMITGAERRRKWSAEEKAEIVAESLAEGAVVSDVARRHGLSPQQLFGWRARMARQCAVARCREGLGAVVRYATSIRAGHRGERAAVAGCTGLAGSGDGNGRHRCGSGIDRDCPGRRHRARAG
jgi:transposase-like protein